MVAALEQRAHKGDTVALAIRREDVSYPYFGERLDRRVVFDSTAPGSDWIVAAPGKLGGLTMRPVVVDHGWRLYRR